MERLPEPGLAAPTTVEGLALIGHANSLQDGYHAVQRARCRVEYSKITGWCNRPLR